MVCLKDIRMELFIHPRMKIRTYFDVFRDNIVEYKIINHFLVK